mmetsp:Transcript_27212/g.97245  ORF Transcript_27212/g.97245 Transcript_27212/m.97245 type:complete len:461 (+) Transcript_27212:5659-7041(+)
MLPRRGRRRRTRRRKRARLYKKPAAETASRGRGRARTARQRRALLKCRPNRPTAPRPKAASQPSGPTVPSGPMGVGRADVRVPRRFRRRGSGRRRRKGSAGLQPRSKRRPTCAQRMWPSRRAPKTTPHLMLPRLHKRHRRAPSRAKRRRRFSAAASPRARTRRPKPRRLKRTWHTRLQMNRTPKRGCLGRGSGGRLLRARGRPLHKSRAAAPNHPATPPPTRKAATRRPRARFCALKCARRARAPAVFRRRAALRAVRAPPRRQIAAANPRRRRRRRRRWRRGGRRTSRRRRTGRSPGQVPKSKNPLKRAKRGPRRRPRAAVSSAARPSAWCRRRPPSGTRRVQKSRPRWTRVRACPRRTWPRRWLDLGRGSVSRDFPSRRPSVRRGRRRLKGVRGCGALVRSRGNFGERPHPPRAQVTISRHRHSPPTTRASARKCLEIERPSPPRRLASCGPRVRKGE